MTTTPEPTDKLDAATKVVVNDPRTIHSALNGSYGAAPADLKGLLEPDAGRLASPVPRGAGHRKVSGLPGGRSSPCLPRSSERPLSSWANGRFEVGRDKTDAGMREVDMLPLLREILTEHKAASARTGPDDPVFVTSTGKPRSRHNLRQDVVDAVMTHANRLVEQHGLQPLPLGITPHKLRHTYASILVAIGKNPTYAAARPHRPGLHTAGLLPHDAPQRGRARAAQSAFVQGHVWAANGQREPAPGQPAHRTTDS